jgi:hypothetical protein
VCTFTTFCSADFSSHISEGMGSWVTLEDLLSSSTPLALAYRLTRKELSTLPAVEG